MKANKGLRWYDRVSHLFDRFNDCPYQRVREATIQQLGSVLGDTVIDRFCGTGVNFGSLLSRLENRGTIIAIMDIYCPEGTLSASVINLLGAGDPRLDVSSHKPWQHLHRLCVEYRQFEFDLFRLLRCSVVVASGAQITLDGLTDVRRDPESLTGTVPEPVSSRR